jgi:RHS repeat-associated protein
MQLQGRTFSSGDYRCGFNGKEKDSETYGEGNIYDYGFRIYNPRIARFLSVDPLIEKYPWYTPYQFAGNKPIIAIDLDGLEEKIVIHHLGRYDGLGQDGSFYIKSTEVTIDHNSFFLGYDSDGNAIYKAITKVYVEYQGQTKEIGYLEEDAPKGGMKPSAEYDYTKNAIDGKGDDDRSYAGWNPIKWGKILWRDLNAPDNAKTVSDLNDLGTALLAAASARSIIKNNIVKSSTKLPNTAAANTEATTIIENNLIAAEPKALPDPYSRFTKFEKHYAKHFKTLSGSMSRPAYYNRATKLADSEIGNDILGFTSKAGTIFKLNKRTGEFVVINPDGKISSFYRRANNPVKYLETQMTKYGVKGSQ